MKKVLLISFLGLTTQFNIAFGQVKVSMVYDINNGPGHSDPRYITQVGNVFYFSAFDDAHGWELWKSDGIITQLVEDIYPGSESSYAGWSTIAKIGFGEKINMVEYQGTLFFTADDGTNGMQLYKIALGGGVVMVKLINPTASAEITDLLVCNSKLFFIATKSDTTRNDLWSSDGTEAGTTVVKQIDTQPQEYFATTTYDQFNSWVADLTALNDLVYFAANDEVHGTELWQSDGTKNGTRLVKDIYPLIYKIGFKNDTMGYSSSPHNLFAAGGVLCFAANTEDGVELWKHDPSNYSTTMVTDINPGPASSEPTNFAIVNNTLFFSATTANSGVELWKVNLSGSGASQVKEINPGGDSDPSNLTSFKGELFFAADDGANGRELWKSNGTSVGTILYDDINQGPKSSNPDNLTVVGKYSLYFSATDSVYGSSLMESNGLLNDVIIIPGSTESHPSHLKNVNDNLYFGAYGAYGYELMELIGNTTYISELKNSSNLNPKINVYPNPSSDFIKVTIDGQLLGSSYFISDQLGRTLLTGKLVNEFSTINVNELAVGIYMFKIENQNPFKLIKK